MTYSVQRRDKKVAGGGFDPGDFTTARLVAIGLELFMRNPWFTMLRKS